MTVPKPLCLDVVDWNILGEIFCGLRRRMSWIDQELQHVSVNFHTVVSKHEGRVNALMTSETKLIMILLNFRSHGV